MASKWFNRVLYRNRISPKMKFSEENFEFKLFVNCNFIQFCSNNFTVELIFCWHFCLV
jgi:hypothetical protein